MMDEVNNPVGDSPRPAQSEAEALPFSPPGDEAAEAAAALDQARADELPTASEFSEPEAAEDEEVADVAPLEETPDVSAEPTGERHWYILKVQSNREESIKDALLRRVAIAGLEGFFGEVIVPTEKVTEFKAGKKRVTKRKLYPGYIVVNMEINDDTWFLVRETPGIGDFTGSGGRPTPMLPHEVNRIVEKQEEKTDEAPKLKIGFKNGDRVRINEGTFESFEGEVDVIDETNGRVTVMINIFGRSTAVELEYWKIEAV